MPALTRKEMEEVIKRGESVVYEGRICETLADLPHSAEANKDNPEQLKADLAESESKVANLEKDIAKLKAALTAAEAPKPQPKK